jgi:hypothetical protein
MKTVPSVSCSSFKLRVFRCPQPNFNVCNVRHHDFNNYLPALSLNIFEMYMLIVCSLLRRALSALPSLVLHLVEPNNLSLCGPPQRKEKLGSLQTWEQF